MYNKACRFGKKNTIKSKRNIFKRKQINNRTRKYKQKGGKYNEQMISTIVQLSQQINNEFNLPEYISQFDLNQLKIDNSLKYIERIYNEDHYLVLRKYNGEKKLMIACGNYRLDNRNLDPCDETNGCNQILENKYHSHRDYYTIDASLVANPSIVSDFNNSSIVFKTIPSNSFDLIVFEGGADPSSNPNEIKRLLNSNTNSFCISLNESKYVVYSYWFEGKYKVNNFR